jgi:hypothetical protein
MNYEYPIQEGDTVWLCNEKYTVVEIDGVHAVIENDSGTFRVLTLELSIKPELFLN